MPADDVAVRARRLVEDLNMTTMSWPMPSESSVEDFAGGELGLAGREQRLTDIAPGGADAASRRAFSLYASADAANVGEPFALLIEPSGPGTWRLLVADAGRAVGGMR